MCEARRAICRAERRLY